MLQAFFVCPPSLLPLCGISFRWANPQNIRRNYYYVSESYPLQGEGGDSIGSYF